MTQKQINDTCVTASKVARLYHSNLNPVRSNRLRNCKAEVYAYDTGKGLSYVLKSYSTIVAMVWESGECYDFLRYVYGYTATSAQHISKFFKDYAPANAERLTYRY